MSLTKQQFLDNQPRTIEAVAVPGFGDVWVGSVSPLTESRRETALRDEMTGSVMSDAFVRTNIYSLIDQICTDEKGTPLFAEDDFDALMAMNDSRKIQPLIQAIQMFNGAKTDPNG